MNQINDSRGKWWAVGSLFLISMGLLLYELSVSRIFSVEFTYHYAFVIVSGSILGLGLGAMYAHFRLRAVRNRWRDVGLPTWVALGMGSSVGVVTYLMVKAGVVSHPIILEMGFAWFLVLALLPFFFGGVVLSMTFARLTRHSGLLYSGDLLGAALGALGAIYLLNQTSAVNTNLVAGVVMALGGLASSGVFRIGRWASGWTLAIALGALAANVGWNVYGEVPIGRNLDKDLYRLTVNPTLDLKVLEQRWSAFGRTDLVQVDEQEMSIFVDGAAGTPMYRFSGDFARDTTLKSQLTSHHFPLFFPFPSLEPEEKNSALIIGPGGGRDVLVTLLAGVDSITAVEINPDILEIVRDYEDFNGGIYTRYPQVRTVLAEGRSFVARSDQSYDLIILTLPITKSSRSLEGFALTENFLFTVEAIEDYLDHLTPEGRLVIVAHNAPEVFRLVGLVLEAYDRIGIDATRAMKHVYTVDNGMLPLLVVKRSAFTPEEAELRHAALHLLRYRSQTSFVPHVEQVSLTVRDPAGIPVPWKMFDDVLMGLSTGDISMEDFVKRAPLNLSPVTDDQPFFYQMELGLPATVKNLLWWSVLLVAGMFAFPLWPTRTSSSENHLSRAKIAAAGWLALLLGAGFMLIEVAMIQKSILFLGHPVYSVAIVLAILLAGAGLGSLFSSLFQSLRVSLSSVGFIIGGLVLMLIWVMPELQSHFLGSPFPTRMSLLAVSLFPLAFVLGMPFPLLLRWADRLLGGAYVAWIWSINGAVSVLGAVLAIVLALKLGYSSALILGTGVYVLVGLSSLRFMGNPHVQTTFTHS